MKKSLALVALVTGALVLSGCGGTASDTDKSEVVSPTNTVQGVQPSATDQAEPVDKEVAAAAFEDGVLTTADMKIVITDHKVIPVGKKGNEYGDKPVVAFWYKTTNFSDKDVSPMNFLFAFTAFQDNNPNAENELNVGGLPDDQFLDSQLENIKKGGTVASAIAYELDDLKTPVDLVASEDLGITELGKQTFDIK